MAEQDTLINGNRWSFVSIDVQMNGMDQPKSAFTAVNYKGTQEPGIVQTNQVEIAGRTAGYGVGSGSLTMLRREFNQFVANLTNDGELPIMGVDFDMQVAYSDNQGADVTRDELRGARITDVDFSNAKGNSEAVVVLTLSIARLRLAGLDLFRDTTGEAQF